MCAERDAEPVCTASSGRRRYDAGSVRRKGLHAGWVRTTNRSQAIRPQCWDRIYVVCSTPPGLPGHLPGAVDVARSGQQTGIERNSLLQATFK